MNTKKNNSPAGTEPHALLLFDGVCNSCNASVQFILKRDKRGYFQFASLQSDAAQAILKQYYPQGNYPDSIILIENGKAYSRSAAALRLARKLGSLWPLLYGFIGVPSFIRDAVYDFIAIRRYKWFGKREICMRPEPEWKERFLE
jgi:predicted DCC family thiol-disulfide oxidoreductase YuxK